MSGLLQNSNERLFAEAECDWAPTLYRTHDFGEQKDAILTVERVELLEDVLYDFVSEWQKDIKHAGFDKFCGEMTYVDCRLAVQQLSIDPHHHIVKDLLIELFHSEDNTLAVDQSIKHLFMDLCERLEPILADYFSDVIDRQAFCIEECVVENIGMRPNAHGYMTLVVLDGGIPNTDFLMRVLNMAQHEPIIT